MTSLRFPPDAGVDGQVAVSARVPGRGAPPVHLHDAGLDQVQAREELAGLRVRARRDRERGLLYTTRDRGTACPSLFR